MQKLVHRSSLVRSLTAGSCLVAAVACQPVATTPAPTPVYTATIPLEPGPVDVRSVNEPAGPTQSKELAAVAPAATTDTPPADPAPGAVTPAAGSETQATPDTKAPTKPSTAPAPGAPAPAPAATQAPEAPEQAPAKPTQKP